MLNLDEGKIAVTIARKSIEHYLEKNRNIDLDGLPPVFYEKRGVFVTLNKKTSYKELRGCIGRPYPVLPLGEAIAISAVDAAIEDPRFESVRANELTDIVIEVTILTMPRRLKEKPAQLPDVIRIGKDGLIVKKGYYQGLLLPQVAVEHNFDSEEFLCQTCVKAGLCLDEWLDSDTEVYSFEGQIFEEVEPAGEVKEKKIE